MAATTHNNEKAHKDADYMHGAAVIDKNGKEHPITEEMIEKALKQILKASKTSS
ncbi:hypothetical protein HF888_09425 [Bermanella marisrubri]|uniref:Erythronate-4-phosphate dehydrogenase n=1 Tax=Bermanella marisrubri TaxID=207949 RepID=Q1N6E6_9GAMM|nr:PA1571 family protein [Bermanella marisrubri]EAT13646.1 erythronate-4-phosphate dehydrogenase [Oceanobacter sp. RED65] [Bermanella marisrubri]QIZ82717.1 hypothetical protein HF888_09425 [Bermanella marisrubri]